MRIYRGVRGLPRCNPSLPYIPQPRFENVSPTAEDWAFLLDHRRMYLAAAARVFGWRYRHFSKTDLINAMTPAIISALCNWSPGRATKKTVAYNAARYHCLHMKRSMYLCPGDTGRMRRYHGPVHLGIFTPTACDETDAEYYDRDRGKLMLLLTGLNSRLREMVVAKLGLCGDPKTYKQIAEQWGITAGRAQNLVNTGLRKLKYQAMTTNAVDLTPTSGRFLVYRRGRSLPLDPKYWYVAWTVGIGVQFMYNNGGLATNADLLSVDAFWDEFRRIKDSEKKELIT